MKGDYHIQCSSAECDGVADHCLKYALSNPKNSNYENECSNNHNTSCEECNHLSESIVQVKVLIKEATDLTKEDRTDIEYDINNLIKSILLWKAHILMMINQELDLIWKSWTMKLLY